MDGQGDNITFAKDIDLFVEEIKASLQSTSEGFQLSVENEGGVETTVGIDIILNLPPNIQVIFREFGVFSATYLNTTNPVPINQLVNGGNSILLKAEGLRVNASTIVNLPIIFDLFSSSHLGKQFITATISEMRNREDVIVLAMLNTDDDTAAVIASLELLDCERCF